MDLEAPASPTGLGSPSLRDGSSTSSHIAYIDRLDALFSPLGVIVRACLKL